MTKQKFTGEEIQALPNCRVDCLYEYWIYIDWCGGEGTEKKTMIQVLDSSKVKGRIQVATNRSRHSLCA